MLRLTPEDTLLLLSCRPYLDAEDDARLARVAAGPMQWAYVLWRAENNRILPLVEYHVRRLKLFAKLPAEIADYLKRSSILSRLRSLEQYRHLGLIVDALERNGIASFLLKGSAVGAIYYPDPLIRPMQDLDLMIRIEDAERAERVLFELGFDHGIFDPATGEWKHDYRTVTPRALSGHHGLHAFMTVVAMVAPFSAPSVPKAVRHKHVKCHIDAAGTMRMPLFVDLHINLSVGIDPADVWSGFRLETVVGRVVRVQSVTSMLWFIAARLYHEAFEFNTLKLLMLGDVDTILRRAVDRINWPELLAIAYKYEMRPSLYYVLAQAQTLLRTPVPPAALDLLRPDPRQIPLEHDWGDVIPKLFSVPYLAEVELA